MLFFTSQRLYEAGVQIIFSAGFRPCFHLHSHLSFLNDPLFYVFDNFFNIAAEFLVAFSLML